MLSEKDAAYEDCECSDKRRLETENIAYKVHAEQKEVEMASAEVQAWLYCIRENDASLNESHFEAGSISEFEKPKNRDERRRRKRRAQKRIADLQQGVVSEKLRKAVSQRDKPRAKALWLTKARLQKHSGLVRRDGENGLGITESENANMNGGGKMPAHLEEYVNRPLAPERLPRSAGEHPHDVARGFRSRYEQTLLGANDTLPAFMIPGQAAARAAAYLRPNQS